MIKKIFLFWIFLINFGFILKTNSQQKAFAESFETKDLSTDIIEYYDSKKSLELEKKISDAFKSDEFRRKFEDKLKKLSFQGANRFIESINSSLPKYLVSILADKLNITLGQELGDTVGEFFANFSIYQLYEMAAEGIDFSKPGAEVIKDVINKALKPNKQLSRKIGLDILRDAIQNKFFYKVIDKQSISDLEIFNKLEPLAEKMCRARTEIGKIFFASKIGSPSKDKESLKRQSSIIRDLSALESEEFDKIDSALGELSKLESGVLAFWNETSDIHLQRYIWNNKESMPTLVKDLPIVKSIPKFKELAEKLQDKPFFEFLALFKDKFDVCKDVGFSSLAQLLAFCCNVYSIGASVKDSFQGKNLEFLSIFMPAFNKSTASFDSEPLQAARTIDWFINFKKTMLEPREQAFIEVNGIKLRLKYLWRYIEQITKIKSLLSTLATTAIINDICNRLTFTQNLEDLKKLLDCPIFKGDLNFDDPGILSMLTEDDGFIAKTYKQLRKCKKDLVPLMAAIGELDAQMSIVKLLKEKAQNEDSNFCIAEFDFESASPYINTDECWNAEIDRTVVKSNNFKIGGIDSKGDPIPRCLIVSGPNAGGKSTNTLAIIQAAILAQSLGIAPAKRFKFTPFSKIQVYRNIKDNPSEGDSLFKAEVKRASELYKTAKTLKSSEFVLSYFDEPYRGTNADEGSIISYHRLEQFGELDHALTIATTHFRRLRELAQKHSDKFQNQKVECVIDSGKYTYTYKLIPGFSMKCNAFEILKAVDGDLELLKRCEDTFKFEAEEAKQKKLNESFGVIHQILSSAQYKFCGFDIDVISNLFLFTKGSRAFVKDLGDDYSSDKKDIGLRFTFLTEKENTDLKKAIALARNSERKELPHVDNAEKWDKDYKAYLTLGFLLSEYYNNNTGEMAICDIFRQVTASALADPMLKARAYFASAKMYYKNFQALTDENKKKEEIGKALEYFKKAEQKDDIWAAHGSALYLGKMKYYGHGLELNIEEAKNYFEPIADQSENIPAQIEANYYLGLIAVINKDEDAAKLKFEKALAYDHDCEFKGDLHHSFGRLGNLTREKKIEHLKKARELLIDPAKRGEACYDLACVYDNKIDPERDPKLALLYFKESSESVHTNTNHALFYFGEILQFDELDLEMAKQKYEKVIQSDADESLKRRAYANLGEIYFSKKEYDKSKDCFENAISLPKSSHEVGWVEKFFTGMIVAVRECIEKILGLSYQAKAHYYLGRIYFEGLGVKKDLNEAKSKFLQSIAISSSQEVFRSRSYAYLTELLIEESIIKSEKKRVKINDEYFDFYDLRKKALESDDLYAKAHIDFLDGFMYAKGIYCRPNASFALRDLNEAASQRVNERARIKALLLLMDMHIEGVMIDSNYSEAWRLSLGVPDISDEADIQADIFYQKGKVMHVHRKTIQLETGEYQDKAKARNLLEKSANFSNYTALRSLYCAFYMGLAYDFDDYSVSERQSKRFYSISIQMIAKLCGHREDKYLISLLKYYLIEALISCFREREIFDDTRSKKMYLSFPHVIENLEGSPLDWLKELADQQEFNQIRVHSASRLVCGLFRFTDNKDRYMSDVLRYLKIYLNYCNIAYWSKYGFRQTLSDIGDYFVSHRNTDSEYCDKLETLFINLFQESDPDMNSLNGKRAKAILSWYLYRGSRSENLLYLQYAFNQNDDLEIKEKANKAKAEWLKSYEAEKSAKKDKKKKAIGDQDVCAMF